MKTGILALALVIGSVGAAAANELTITYGNTVKPDAKLQEFVDAFRGEITANVPDYKKINAMFAPQVKAFSRSLDPTAPWFKMKPIVSDYLDGIIDVIVEQAPLPDDAKQPDYRPDALSMMADILASGPMGKIKDIPGAVCAPAAWSYDVAAAKKFAESQESEVSGLRFYGTNKTLLSKPKASAGAAGIVPAQVPLIFAYEKDSPEGWGHYQAANGVAGYMKDDAAKELHVSQMHVCFGKVSGKYKVTGIFGYGL